MNWKFEEHILSTSTAKVVKTSQKAHQIAGKGNFFIAFSCLRNHLMHGPHAPPNVELVLDTVIVS
jgi:hypothetical protein